MSKTVTVIFFVLFFIDIAKTTGKRNVGFGESLR